MSQEVPHVNPNSDGNGWIMYRLFVMESLKTLQGMSIEVQEKLNSHAIEEERTIAEHRTEVERKLDKISRELLDQVETRDSKIAKLQHEVSTLKSKLAIICAVASFLAAAGGDFVISLLKR